MEIIFKRKCFVKIVPTNMVLETISVLKNNDVNSTWLAIELEKSRLQTSLHFLQPKKEPFLEVLALSILRS